MYVEYENEINEEDLLYEQAQRPSDIQLPPVINTLLLAIWIVIFALGLAVIYFGKNALAGAIIIAVPTFIGMVIKPTFALCMMMLALPTGAGIGYRQLFSLDRGVGIALAVSFLLNILITRPRLRIGNKVLWVLVAYTVWIFLASLGSRYIGLELRRAFTQVQLLALVFIVYWILQTNGPKAFLWGLRAYLIGTLGAIALVFITGAAVRLLQETHEGRYGATLGQAIDPNMLAALTSLAFLASIYLLARDKNLLWRTVYLAAILFLPIMLLRIGSRGNLVALVFTLLSPLVFIRQVARKPALAGLLLVVILLASVSAGVMLRGGGLERGVEARLTNVRRAEEAMSYRMLPIRAAIKSAMTRPTGTGYWAWFERSGLPLWPHSDFFLALGVYGLPGAALFATLIIMIILTVRRTPLGTEKLFIRAALTFLLVVGLNIGQIYHKYFWAFLAFVIAGERIARAYVPMTDLESSVELEDDSLRPVSSS